MSGFLKLQYTCLQCSIGYRPRAKTSKFCSARCYGEWQSENCIGVNSRRPRLILEDKKCPVCEKIFSLKSNYIDRAYCSRKCYDDAQKIFRKGEKSHLWKGGLTKAHIIIRNSAAYREWRKAVFERDNYQCVICKDKRGGNLQADHIKQFAFYPELRLELSNGRTLCIDCHKKTETYLNNVKI